MLKQLWLDEAGAVLSAELILLLVITVIGVGIGMVALRDAVNAELVDVAAAVASVDPGYMFAGTTYTPDMSLNDGMQDSSVNGSTYEAQVLTDPTGMEAATVLASTTPDGTKMLP